MPTGIYTRTAYHKKKISNSMKGKIPKNFYDIQKLGWKSVTGLKEEKSFSWKGDKVGYGGIHIWIRKKLGRPSKCTRCGTKQSKRYEWANISRKYKRDINDWERLCKSCHEKDHWKKGERIINKSVFKKGHIPWNKNTRPSFDEVQGDC